MTDSFLHQTAVSILQKIDLQQLSHTTMVLPSHRAGLVLKNELLHLLHEQKQQAVWAPTVATLQQLQGELSPLYDEDELLTIVRLYRYYRHLNEGDEDLMPLDMFYGWGRQMLADFTNIDASMPSEQVPNFFANTIAAHELSQLDLDKEIVERLRALINPLDDEPAQHIADSIRNQYKKIWQQLDVLYQSLRTEMSAEQKGYSGMRQRAVIECWEDDYVQSRIAGRTFVFVGFNYLLPVERELMEKLSDSKQALFYWDYKAGFQTNKVAFSFAQLNSGILGNVLPVRPWDTQREVTMIACSSREAQAQYVHHWLQQNYTHEGQKVGVVICDETMLESVIYALPAIKLPGKDESEPVNITKGFPLRNTHIFTRVLTWLYDKARGDAEQIVTPLIIDQLLNALISESETQEQSEISVETEHNGMNWKELLIMESEYQVRKVANQMRKLITDGIGDVPFTLKLLRLLMRRTMESIMMPFHGEPVTDIQIMGVLETRMLDFDKLLILNVEEGVLPQKQADCSFIPYYLRKAYSMQTPDERATVYAYNFFRLLSRAGHSTLLFTSADSADNSKGMSRFLMQMLVNPQEFNVHKIRLDEPSVLDYIDDERLKTEGTSMLATLVKGEDHVLYYPDGKRFSLSPSALNTYISCPRKFCLQYIQGLRETEKETARFSPATLGSFVHNAMQYLYEEYLSCTKENLPVSPDSIGQILDNDQLIETAVAKAYEMMNAEWLKKHQGEPDHYKPEEHKPEKPVIIQFIRHILEYDKATAGQNRLQILWLEKNCRFDIDLGEIGIVQTGGRIDRVDMLESGEQALKRVVDYKSGKYDEKDMIASMDDLMSDEKAKYIRQTLIYSEAVKAHEPNNMTIEPNLFFCSRAMSGLRTTIALDSHEIHDYNDVREDFLMALKEKIREVLTTTSFPPCDEKACSAFCPFLGLCRRKVYTSE